MSRRPHGHAPDAADLGQRIRARCKPLGGVDLPIAAIALSRGAALVTRNSSDFEGCGIAVHNPWTAV